MSHSVSTRAEEVIAAIQAAFAEVERLPDEQLFVPAADDLWVDRLLGGSGPWSAVPDSAIEYENAALTAVTTSGLQFFLPAYMCWTLRNPQSSSATVDNTIYRLADEGTRLTARGFSTAQRQAVQSFLAWAAETSSVDSPAAQLALQYWRHHVDET